MADPGSIAAMYCKYRLNPSPSAEGATKEYPQNQAYISAIEGKVTSAIKAINDRNWSREHWATITDQSFTADTGALLRPEAANTAAVPLGAWLDSLDSLTKERPDYHVKIIDTSTTIKDRKHATCYLNVEFSGAFPGVVRYSILVWRFVCMDSGEWMATRLDLFVGLIGDGGADEGEEVDAGTITSNRHWRCLELGWQDSMEQLYDEVPLDPQEVRLLRYLPDRTDQILSFEMKAFPLDEAIAYTALSYCWGKDAPSKHIVINGHEVLVRTNLFAWLELSSTHNDTAGSWIFIDALCINQDDNREKAIQVELMGDIYRSADRVEAWLGSGRKLRDGELELRRGYCQSVHEILETYNEPREHIRSLFADKKTSKSALVLMLNLLLAEYWKRLWIVQEVAFAQNLDIRLGELCIDWAVLMEITHYFFKGYSGYDRKSGPVDHELIKRFVYQTPAAWSSDYIPEMIRAVQILEQRAEALREPGSHLPPCVVLVEYAFQECTVPHDKIYGLIGLSQSEMKIDYDISLSSLFIRAFIESLMDIWEYDNFPEDDWEAAQQTMALTSALLKCLLRAHPYHPVAFVVTYAVLENVAGRKTAMAAIAGATMSAGTWVPFLISSLDALPEIVGWWLAPIWWTWSMMLMCICQMRVVIWRWSRSTKRMPGDSGKAMTYHDWRQEVDRTYGEVLEELYSGGTILEDIYRRLLRLQTMNFDDAKALIQMVAAFPTPNERSELYYHIFGYFRGWLQLLDQDSFTRFRIEQDRKRMRAFSDILILGLTKNVGWSCNMLPFYARFGELMVEVQEKLLTEEERRRKKQ